MPNIVKIKPGQTYNPETSSLSSSRPSRRGSISLGEALTHQSPERGRSLLRHGLPQNDRGYQQAGSYTIVPGEKSRIRYHPRQSSASNSDLLAKHYPRGVPLLERVEYRSRSRTPPSRLSRSDPTPIPSRLIEPRRAIRVEHTAWKEIHPDHKSRRGFLQQAQIHTSHEPTNPELQRILEYFAPGRQSVSQADFEEMDWKLQKKYARSPNSSLAKSSVIGIQQYDKYGYVSTTTRGKEQGPDERKEDDRIWLSRYAPGTKHTSGNRCTEQSNNNQMYEAWDFSKLSPVQRLHVIRNANIRTNTIDAVTLEAKSGCEDYPRQSKVGCKSRNDHYGVKDVASSSRSGRTSDMYIREVSRAEFEELIRRDRERGKYPPQRRIFEFDNESLNSKSTSSSDRSSRRR